MRKQEGITLIALVITIIVLLILAGVTIAMLTGENGLLSRATSTKEASDLGTAKELISLHVNNCISLYYQETFVEEKETKTYANVGAAATAGVTAAGSDASWPKNVELSGTASMEYTPSGKTVTIDIDPDTGAVEFDKP